MADLDYVKVVGRLGITRGDGADAGDEPDTVWCDEGSVIFEPVIPEMKVVGGTEGPFTVGNAAIPATVDTQGWVTFNGQPFVWLLDLGSDKVNPRVDAEKATYKVSFSGVKCQGAKVSFTAFSFHPTPGQDNDLTLLSPVPATGGTPIVQGPQGVSVVDAEVAAGELLLTLDDPDGTVVNAGALPVGPGGSDAGVASYLADAGSATYAAADTATTALVNDDTSALHGSLTAAFAEVVAPGFRRTRTRNTGILRPRIRDIATRVARTKPLITATNTTAAISNQVNVTLSEASPYHSFYGAVAWHVGGAINGFCSLDPHSTTYNVPWVDEFVTDAPVFAVEMTGGGQLIEVLVNGEQVRAPAVLAGGAWMLVDWNGVRAVRRYTIRGQGGMVIKTIRRNAIDSLFAPASDSWVKAAWLGDSYSQTLGRDGISTLPMLTCDMLGWKVAASVEGGTGYDQPDPATTVASFQARVVDVVAAAPDVVVLAGGHNIRDTPTEQASIVATIEALQAGLPGVPVLAFGAFYGSGPTFGEAGYATENAAIQAACAATGAVFLSTSGWITGTGKVDSLVGDGNADALISTDGTHPQTGIGGDYFAARCADAITGSTAI